MKHLTLIIISLLFSFTLLPTAFAATVDINWVEPGKYQDIDPGNSHKKRFQKRVFETLENQFRDLAKNLPENYQMKISVTDIDLAGDVQFTNTNRIRIVKDLYFPRMHFSYELLGKEQKSLKTAEVKIKDMRFLQALHSASRRNDFLYYESKMIEDWFNKTFAEYLVQK